MSNKEIVNRLRALEAGQEHIVILVEDAEGNPRQCSVAEYEANSDVWGFKRILSGGNLKEVWRAFDALTKDWGEAEAPNG